MRVLHPAKDIMLASDVRVFSARVLSGATLAAEVKDPSFVAVVRDFAATAQHKLKAPIRLADVVKPRREG